MQLTISLISREHLLPHLLILHIVQRVLTIHLGLDLVDIADLKGTIARMFYNPEFQQR